MIIIMNINMNMTINMNINMNMNMTMIMRAIVRGRRIVGNSVQSQRHFSSVSNIWYNLVQN
jgi:hypothetical protein